MCERSYSTVCMSKILICACVTVYVSVYVNEHVPDCMAMD